MKKPGAALQGRAGFFYLVGGDGFEPPTLWV